MMDSTNFRKLKNLICKKCIRKKLFMGLSLVVLTLMCYYILDEREKRLPQAIIIGVKKCGTRALIHFLNIHPSVSAALPEIHFFDRDDNYAKGIDWYCSMMPYSYPWQITIEKSPAYFTTEKVPEKIYRFNSSIKLLLILRNPVTRTISDYTQYYAQEKRRNSINIKKFEHKVMNPLTLKVNSRSSAVNISIYEKHLKRYARVFKKNQIHIVDGDKLITNPVLEMAKVEQFLGLPRFFTPDTFYYNKTRGFFCSRKEGMEVCLNKDKGRQHPQIDPFVRYKLKKFFKPHNDRLFQLIGQTFDWN